MYPPPSDRFLSALAQSHRVVTVVELHRTDGTVVVLPHTGGSVTVDRGAAVRRTCTVTVPDTSLIPMTPSAEMAIYGARLRILRGIQYGDGTVETVPLGVFRVDSLAGDPDLGPVTIAGSGLEAVFSDDRFTEPYSTRANSAAVTAITGLVRESIPGIVVVSTVSDEPLGPRTWDRDTDRWDAVRELATAVGAEAYVDADGQVVVAELPDLLTAPVAWSVDAGPGGVLISAERGYSREGMYNVVVASGENTETNAPLVTAIAEDDDPTSPTYVSGPFGRVPRFYSSPTLTTTAHAQAAANTLLRSSLKPTSQADITALPNPCLEPGDVIRVTYGSGDRELHQVQSYTIDLSGGDFTLTTISAKEDA